MKRDAPEGVTMTLSGRATSQKRVGTDRQKRNRAVSGTWLEISADKWEDSVLIGILNKMNTLNCCIQKQDN